MNQCIFSLVDDFNLTCKLSGLPATTVKNDYYWRCDKAVTKKKMGWSWRENPIEHEPEAVEPLGPYSGSCYLRHSVPERWELSSQQNHWSCHCDRITRTITATEPQVLSSQQNHQSCHRYRTTLALTGTGPLELFPQWDPGRDRLHRTAVQDSSLPNYSALEFD